MERVQQLVDGESSAGTERANPRESMDMETQSISVMVPATAREDATVVNPVSKQGFYCKSFSKGLTTNKNKKYLLLSSIW